MAEIIYPAAFNTPGTRASGTSAFDATAIESSDEVVAMDAELTELRAAAIETQRHLVDVDGETRELERLGQDMKAEVATVEAVGIDLGQQMERLIAETRRMAAYLRGAR